MLVKIVLVKNSVCWVSCMLRLKTNYTFEYLSSLTSPLSKFFTRIPTVKLKIPGKAF